MLLLKHTAQVQRYQAVGTNGRQQLATIQTGVRCLALPMDTQASVSREFSLGRGYDIYFDRAQDIREGDRLTISSQDYMVKGLQHFDVDIVGHLHALCVQEVTHDFIG